MEHNKADLTAALLHDQSNPIDYRGDTEGMIDFLYGFYVAYVPLCPSILRTDEGEVQSGGAGCAEANQGEGCGVPNWG